MYGAAAGDCSIVSREHDKQEILLTGSAAGRSDSDDAGVCPAD